MLQLPPSLPLQNRKIIQKVEDRRHPLTSPSENLSKRLGSSCPSLTQQQKRTTSWAQHWYVIPFSCNRKSWIGPPSIKPQMGAQPISSSDCPGRFSQTKHVKYSVDRQIPRHSTTQGKLVQCSGQ